MENSICTNLEILPIDRSLWIPDKRMFTYRTAAKRFNHRESMALPTKLHTQFTLIETHFLMIRFPNRFNRSTTSVSITASMNK
jgi:hypothetical protein